METAHSGVVRRFATRYAIVYFGLYALASPMVSYLLTWPDFSSVGEHPWSQLVSWVGAHVFRLEGVIAVKGSGDRVFDWVQVVTFAAMSGAVAVVWTLLGCRARATDGGVNRSRDADRRLEAWLRTGLRFALGAVLAYYGAIKVFPVQAAPLSLMRLLQPVGGLSPEQLMWTWLAASPLYQALVGIAEVAAAVLLFVPWTASAGALIALVELLHIFALDVGFQVPVRLFVFHLVIMAVVLAAPDVPRLFRAWRGCAAVPPRPIPPPLFARRSFHHVAIAAQLLVGAYVTGVHLYGAHDAWRSQQAAESAPLYGIWIVETMAEDGVVRPPLITDDQRWQRIVIESGFAFLQRMDDTFVPHRASVDAGGHVVTLTREADPAWAATLTIGRPTPERLILQGQMDGREVRLDLRLVPRSGFPLVTDALHFVQEPPARN